MNVLLVGLGRWGQKHLRVLGELGVTLWLADPLAERRAWAMSQDVPAGRIVDDYRTALAAVDAVDVVTPAGTHVEIAAAALAAGRHCFVEKPLAASAADARRLAAIATSGRVVQVGHTFRFHPVTHALRIALDEGRIGRVRFATARFAGFKRPRTDVGVTHTDAVHFFDLFAHLFRRRATRVAGLQRDWLGRGLDDMSLTVVHYGDVVTVVEANYFVPGTQRDCVVVGERGSLVADFAAGTLSLHAGEHRRRNGAWDAVATSPESLPVGAGEPLRLELEAFLAACSGRIACPVPVGDGLHALEIVEAASEASRLGRDIALDA